MSTDIRGEQLIAVMDGAIKTAQPGLWGLQPGTKLLMMLYRMLLQPLCWKSSY